MAVAIMTSCADPDTGGPGGGAVIVPDDKLDDFLSLSGQEFVVEGRYTVTLEEELRDADEATRMARVEELIAYQEVAISWFLTQYFIEKKGDDPNSDFGGYGAMAKANSYDELDIQQEDDLTYSFRIYQLIAGHRDLLERMNDDLSPVGDGSYQFVLTIGTPSNEEMARLDTNNEWYRDAPWDGWNPEAVDESQKTDLTLTIKPEIESSDAWFDYQSMFADGLLDIDVHFGWDYHNNYHVVHAEALFNWLQRQDFEAPVATFAELDRNSGPFTRSLDANGMNVSVEVRIFFGHAEGETNPDTDAGGRILEEDMRTSLQTRDVIVYSGHSGPFYGFALANWRQTEEGDLDDSEMSSVTMPSRYQLIFAEGCDTYHIGESFSNNPAKPGGANIDIITTTAPSNASSPDAVQDMITRLIETDDQGRHQPRTMKSLLRDLDSNSFWFQTMYGIHGIDDNPQLHPYAQPDNMCMSCETDTGCGGVGNLCVTIAEGEGRRCVPTCTADEGCPGDARCRSVADPNTSTIYDSACVPAAMSCE